MVAGPRAYGELARLFNIFNGWGHGCRSKGLWVDSVGGEEGGGGGGGLLVYVYTTEGLAYLPGLGATHTNCSWTNACARRVGRTASRQVDRLVDGTPRVHGR